MTYEELYNAKVYSQRRYTLVLWNNAPLTNEAIAARDLWRTNELVCDIMKRTYREN